MGKALRQAMAIAAKDVRAELRSRTSLVTAIGFAALVLVIFNFARDPTRLQASLLAPSALWITSTFAAMTTLTRAFGVETESGALDALRLAPIPREAIYLGKFLGNLAFAVVVEGITLPLFILFFNVSLGDALLGVVAVLLIATIGFTAAGTLFGALVAKLRQAELLLPLLVLPFLVPPLVGGVQLTARLLDGQRLGDAAGWLRLLLVYDVVFVVVGLLVFPSVFDE
jgi:heme exporter protein B